MAIRVELSDPLPVQPQRRLVAELDHLAEAISWETLEDLSPKEASTQITLWAVEWRRLEARAPETLAPLCRHVLELLLEACRRYPGRLGRIEVLDDRVSLDLEREADRAREEAAGEVLRRAHGGWKQDLLQAARDLGIDPDQACGIAEQGTAGEAA